MRVLLVEPYPVLARVLRTGLEEEGIAVHSFESLTQAKRVFCLNSFNVIILDPPREDEFSELIMLADAKCSTPVLLLSVPGEAEQKHENHIGTIARLIKPFQFEELLDRLRVLTENDHREIISKCNAAILEVC